MEFRRHKPNNGKRPQKNIKKKSFRNSQFKKSNINKKLKFKDVKREKKYQSYYANGSKKFYDAIKERLFDILGGTKCDSCGFRDQRALGFTLKGDPNTFDEIRRGGFAASWGKYISNPELARKEIKILCMNCNAIREPEIKSESMKKNKKRSKFFPRKNTNIIHEN